jgi:hypothetical protein
VSVARFEADQGCQIFVWYSIPKREKIYQITVK